MIFFRHTTGIHYTDELVEWAVFRRSSKGIEKVREGSVPVPKGFFEQANAPMFPSEVLIGIRRYFRGIVTVSLPSTHLLMRILELPSTNPQELKSMVDLQMDQISPYPIDQLTVSYEVVHTTENHSRVLAVAAPRKVVDTLGDLFKAQHIYIRSLDAEVLTWWSLLARGDMKFADRTVLMLEEHTEFSMIILDHGIPVRFHSLDLFHDINAESVMHEIAEEVAYTLLSVEAEYGYLPLDRILFWSQSEIPPQLFDILGKHCHAEVLHYDLTSSMPSLAEGLALRTAERRTHHVELVPREWIDLQRRKRYVKIATFASIAILSVWLVSITITGIVFSVQTAAYNYIVKEAEKYQGPAIAAMSAREEMMSLDKYANRSHSALECLREVVLALPVGVEVSSFTYRKGDSIVLRGASESPDGAYTLFQKLGTSELFNGIKDESVTPGGSRNPKTTYTVSAKLPTLEPESQP